MGQIPVWLTNVMYHPAEARAKDVYAFTSLDQNTREREWREYQDWLKDKFIADPKATDPYTVEQLKAMGMVGVYRYEKVAS